MGLNLSRRRGMIGALAFALVLVLGVAVWLWAGREPASTNAPPPEETSEEASRPVSGREIPGLPRYPGSTRIGYETRTDGGLVSTEARYTTTAEPDTVREFYREVFEEEGWSVIDYDYAEGEWSFFVIEGEREATIALGPGDGVTEVNIEFSEPREQTSGERT